MVFLDSDEPATELPILHSPRLPVFLPFVNGGRFESLLEVAAQPQQPAADVTTLPQPLSQAPSTASTTPRASTAAERWRHVSRDHLPSAHIAEIQLTGAPPLKSELGDSWLQPREQKAKEHKADAPSSARLLQCHRRTGRVHDERELRHRDQTQRDGHVLAADTFDRCALAASAAAMRANLLLAETEAEIGAIDNGHRFRRHLSEVRSKRFVAPPRPELPPHNPVAITPRAAGGSPQARLRAERAPFALYRSIWRPRAKWASSNDLYDSDEVLRTRFAQDWQKLLLVLGLGTLGTGHAFLTSQAESFVMGTEDMSS